MTTSRR